MLAVFLSPVFTLAYNPSINDTKVPYEVYEASSNIEARSEYLGELTGEPQMYEFSLGRETNLNLGLYQLDTETPIPFSLIVVKQNDRNAGVVEIVRLKSSEVVWSEMDDSVIGINLLSSQSTEAQLGAGLYRVEVSTPDNFGRYMLRIGEGDNDAGYFKTLGHVYTIQNFFGKSIFSMLKSSYVYYPLGIIILGLLFYFTWRNRQKITHKNA
jgi:hypothetical protein